MSDTVTCKTCGAKNSVVYSRCQTCSQPLPTAAKETTEPAPISPEDAVKNLYLSQRVTAKVWPAGVGRNAAIVLSGPARKVLTEIVPLAALRGHAQIELEIEK